MNTEPEPLRPGPAPAGQPAWIYFPERQQGYHFHDGDQASMPHHWLPAPACPPRPKEKTQRQKDWSLWCTDRFQQVVLLGSIPDFAEEIRADERREFAKELLSIDRNYVQSLGATLIERLEKEAKS